MHGTPQVRPCDRLLEETLTLCAGLNPYQVAHSTARTVGVEALVRYEKTITRCPPARSAPASPSTPATTSSASRTSSSPTGYYQDLTREQPVGRLLWTTTPVVFSGMFQRDPE
jgi:hypothetical protein